MKDERLKALEKQWDEEKLNNPKWIEWHKLEDKAKQAKGEKLNEIRKAQYKIAQKILYDERKANAIKAGKTKKSKDKNQGELW